MSDREDHSLLRLFTAWLHGSTLAAGQCLLVPTPAPQQLIGRDCAYGRCHTVIVGCSEEQVTERRTDHVRRCHA